jgi:ketosteroid isomerase-like protein
MKTLAFALLVALATAGSAATGFKDKDKSKPVRVALTARYAELADAWRRHDLAAVLAMRTPDVVAIQASGQTWDAEAVARYTRAAFAQVESTLTLTFDLDTIDVRGDSADAAVAQHWVRRQMKAGQSRLVDTSARQHETWVRRGNTWSLARVDRVRPGVWLVDGKRIDPSKPYDPSAPPFTGD